MGENWGESRVGGESWEMKWKSELSSLTGGLNNIFCFGYFIMTSKLEVNDFQGGKNGKLGSFIIMRIVI